MPRPATRGWVALIPIAFIVTSSACAARLYTPPTGPGVPFAEAASVWTTITSSCQNASRFVAEVSVGGWTGATRERVPSVKFHTALTKGNDIYLELPGPGRSWVQMAGGADQAVFLLPRDKRYLRESTRNIVEALTGVKWDAVDLLNVLTGCVVPSASTVTGTSFGETVQIDLGGDARGWLRKSAGAWQLVAATRDGLLIEYQARDGAFPSLIRVSSMAAGVTPLQLKFGVGQININIPVEASTFVLPVPPDFVAMSLADLRGNRPAGDGKVGMPVSRKP